jgi:flagellar hook-associated protein 2
MQGVISSLGIASGLDLGQIRDDLVAAERRPAELRLNRRQAAVETELSALGGVKALAEKVQTAAQALDSASLGRRARVSDGGVLRATAGEDAPEGRYRVEVTNLATAQSLASGGFAGTDSVVGTGRLTLQVGTDDPVTIDIGSEAQTLAGIRDAINASGAAVNAAVIDDGGQQRLLLTSQRTGSAGEIDLAAADDDGNDTDATGLSRLAYTSGAQNLAETSAATDASIEVNGLAVTRSANSFDDVIPGVTLDLRSAEPGNPVSVEVEADRSGITGAVEGLIEAYNELSGQLAKATRFDPDSGQAGPLVGDATVRNLLTTLRSTLVSEPGETGGTLVELGIATGSGGRLTLDAEALGAALDRDLDGTLSVLNAAGGAIADVLAGFAEPDGRLEVRTDGLRDRLDDIAEDRRRLDERVSSLEARLTAEFANLDSLVAGFQQTGDFLSRQLARVPTPEG